MWAKGLMLGENYKPLNKSILQHPRSVHQQMRQPSSSLAIMDKQLSTLQDFNV